MPLSTSSTKPFAVRASPILVHLSEDDLCSTVSIGDVLDIVGQANYSLGNGKDDAKLHGDIQVLTHVSCVSCERGRP